MEPWANKLSILEKRSWEVTAKEESLRLYLEDSLYFKKELKGEVSKLMDDLVETSGTYFGCAK